MPVARMILMFGIWAAVLIALPLTGMAGGTYEHARATGKRCATCHTSVRPDADNLNATGRFFQVNRRLPAESEGATDVVVPPARSSTAPPVVQEADGAAIYRRVCAACHGPDGKGTAIAPSLMGDLAQGDSAGRLRDVVRRGVPGTTMAAFEGILSADHIALVVEHVLAMRKRSSRP